MHDMNLLFKGYMSFSEHKLRLCIQDPTCDEMVCDFDQKCALDEELKMAISLCLRFNNFDFDALDSMELIDNAQMKAKTIDPNLYNDFDVFIKDRMKEDTGDFHTTYQRMLHERNMEYATSINKPSCLPVEVSEDLNDFTDSSETGSIIEDFEDIEIMEQICKTGAFPLKSSKTLELAAMCACLVNKNHDLSLRYFQALMLYISRRHDLETRKRYEEFTKPIHAELKLCREFNMEKCSIFDELDEKSLETNIGLAKDIVMLWVFFRLCLLTAHQRALFPLVDPVSFIDNLQSSRPLFVVSNAEYSLKLAQCKTPFQAVMRFIVYGQEDPDRMNECKTVFHAIRLKEKGPRYSKVKTDSFFEWCFRTKGRLAAFSLCSDICHPGFQEQLDALCYEHGENLVRHLKSDESYCERYVHELPTDKPVIALKAACGTGKSVQMLRHIDNSDDEMAFIIISHRKALSAEMQKRTRQTKRGAFDLYSDIEGKIDLCNTRNIICEFESLGRMVPFIGKFCVIIDEANSVLNQTQSSAGDTQAAHAVFVNLMRLADRVLIMDAFLDQDRLDVWNNYVASRPYVIENTFKPNVDHQIWHTRNKYTAKQKLVCLIEQGENVIVPCTLKADAEEVYQLVCALIDPKEVQLYTADSRWQNGDDVNEVWSKARVVIHTSTMDSGHSFELDHFGWAVCFFSNQVAIPVEASLQMKARSRLTKNFIIHIDQRWVPKQAATSIDDILSDVHQNKRQMAEASCRLYYGERGYWDAFRHNGNLVCPFLILYATMRMLKYRSMRNFGRLMYEMLRNDGVKEENIKNLDQGNNDIREAIQKAKKAVKENAKIPSSYALREIYQDTPVQVFDLMNDEEKKFYSESKIVKAYKNRVALHMEGSDLPGALNAVMVKQQRVISAIAVCRGKQGINKDSLFQTELQLGLYRGGQSQDCSSFFRCTSIACALSELFLGNMNPFETVGLSALELRRNLRCSLRKSNTTNPSVYNIFETDQSICKTVLELYSEYLLISDSNKYREKEKKDLSLTEAISIFNDVLTRHFGLKMKRNANRKIKKGATRDCMYEVHDLFSSRNFFCACIKAQDLSVNFEPKPSIIPWRIIIPEIEDADILGFKSVNNSTIISLGKAFIFWPGASSDQRFGYKSVQCEDMKCFEDTNAKPVSRKRQKY